MTKRTALTPWFLSAPALLLFLLLLLVPLVMTFILSFNSFSFYGGIKPTIGLGNYANVLGDSYFYEIFLRTFLIALSTTAICAVIGVPQAYFLFRMNPFLRSIMILIVLGPLLVSVVVRTLGWEIILSNNGIINKALSALGLTEYPVRMMYTTTGIVIALVHVMVPFMILSVWAALQRQDPATVSAAEVSRSGTAHRIPADRVAAGDAGHPVGFADRLFSVCERFRHAGHSRRTPHQGRLDHRLRPVPQHARLAARGGDRHGSARFGAGRHAVVEPPRRTTLRGGFRMRRNGPFALVFSALFAIFMLAPLVVVIGVSLTPKGFLEFPPSGISLRWFDAILANPQFITSAWISLELGVASASLATILAIPAALAIGRGRFAGRDALQALFLSPLTVPTVVLGIAFLRFLTLVSLNGTFVGLMLCHVVIIMPFVLRLVLASVVGLDRSVEKAAISLGASHWTVFYRVTLPAIIPGVIGGWVLAFITSFDELTVTIFIVNPTTTTLPVRLFNHITQTTDPLVASVSTIAIIFTVVLMLIVDRIYGLDRLLIGEGAR